MNSSSAGARLSEKEAYAKETVDYELYSPYSDDAARQEILKFVDEKLAVLGEKYPTKDWGAVRSRANSPWMVFPAYVLSARYVRGEADDYLLSFEAQDRTKEQRFFLSKELMAELPANLRREFVLRELIRETLTPGELKIEFTNTSLDTWISDFAKRNVVPEKFEPLIFKLEELLKEYVSNLNDKDGSFLDAAKDRAIQDEMISLFGRIMQLETESAYIRANLISPIKKEARKSGKATYIHLYKAMISAGIFDVLLRQRIRSVTTAIQDGDMEKIYAAMRSYLVYTQVMMEAATGKEGDLTMLSRWTQEEKHNLDAAANEFADEIYETFLEPIEKEKAYFDSFMPNLRVLDRRHLIRQIPPDGPLADHDSLARGRRAITESEELLVRMQKDMAIAENLPVVRAYLAAAREMVEDMTRVYTEQFDLMARKLDRQNEPNGLSQAVGARLAEALSSSEITDHFSTAALRARLRRRGIALNLHLYPSFSTVAVMTNSGYWDNALLAVLGDESQAELGALYLFKLEGKHFEPLKGLTPRPVRTPLRWPKNNIARFDIYRSSAGPRLLVLGRIKESLHELMLIDADSGRRLRNIRIKEGGLLKYPIIRVLDDRFSIQDQAGDIRWYSLINGYPISAKKLSRYSYTVHLKDHDIEHVQETMRFLANEGLSIASDITTRAFADLVKARVTQKSKTYPHFARILGRDSDQGLMGRIYVNLELAEKLGFVERTSGPETKPVHHRVTEKGRAEGLEAANPAGARFSQVDLKKLSVDDVD
jgi:hypothetical protein